MSVGSRSLPPLWLPPHGVSVCGPYKVVFPSSLESILFGLVNFRFSLLQDVQGLWWLWPWPLIYFVFGLKLLKELALMKTFIRILWVHICLSLGILSPTSLSHILLRWGLLHVLGFSSVSYLNSLKDFPQNVLCESGQKWKVNTIGGFFQSVPHPLPGGEDFLRLSLVFGTGLF